ncbi:MAG: hypothetical protein R2761_27280 [Acidimicrobiales bacterium]
MAQLAAKDRNIFRVLVAFAVFFVLTAPAVAGTQTRNFFGFLGDGWDSFQTYLDGVFDDGTPTGTTIVTTAVTVVLPAAPATTTA